MARILPQPTQPWYEQAAWGQKWGARTKRIFVPTDFSTPSLAALAQAIHYTQAVEGELLLLHVVEGEPLRWYAVDGVPEAPSAFLDPARN